MEAVVLAEGALSAIMTASGGDMRKAVTFLQSSHQLSAGTAVTTAIVTDISGQVNKIDEASNLLGTFINDGVLYFNIIMKSETFLLYLFLEEFFDKKCFSLKKDFPLFLRFEATLPGMQEKKDEKKSRKGIVCNIYSLQCV